MHKVAYLLLLLISVSACKSPEARRPEQQISGSFIKESAERNKELYKKEEAAITKLIAQNPETSFQSSSNGFWYFYNKKDSLQKTTPVRGDLVLFTYDVKDLDGNIIVSEAENGLQEYQVDQSNQELISGIRDGIKLMKAGETVTFLFPSQKAFGYYGDTNKIGTNVPLICNVTLNTITQKETN